jgi:hypothetical protein
MSFFYIYLFIYFFNICAEIVRHEVQKMALPGQTIQIISANHYLHEHPHISIALSKSLKTDTEIDFNNLGYVGESGVEGMEGSVEECGGECGGSVERGKGESGAVME